MQKYKMIVEYHSAKTIFPPSYFLAAIPSESCKSFPLRSRIRTRPFGYLKSKQRNCYF